MKKAVKKLVNLGLTMIIIGVILTQKDTIITFINSYFNLNNQSVTLGEKNGKD